jgi:hypothetical protein
MTILRLDYAATALAGLDEYPRARTVSADEAPGARTLRLPKTRLIWSAFGSLTLYG